ncbi:MULTISPECIES: hypothetical protein [Bradyrhizobium]|uniref:hypothetical protein n=1 Tax=Bradyrhizobium TaxID=374 RepID=UPI0012D343E3|nr:MULTISPECIES: hypothetical protein [Bradyrhizobium]
MVRAQPIRRHFPNGDYVGWEEGLKQYFDEQMSVEQRAALNNWHGAYIGQPDGLEECQRWRPPLA